MLGFVLLVGGVVGVSVLAGPAQAAEWAVGDSEVPADAEVEKEKTLPARAKLSTPLAEHVPHVNGQAPAQSLTRGAPPTPPPKA